MPRRAPNSRPRTHRKQSRSAAIRSDWSPEARGSTNTASGDYTGILSGRGNDVLEFYGAVAG
nr:hypothetical protein [Plasticicumulans sp.]